MFCPSCAKQIPDASTFCLHCGKSVQAPQKQGRKLSKVAWLSLGVVIALVIFFGGPAILDTLKEPPKQPPIAQAPQPPAPVFVPVTQKLTSGQLVVRAGKYIRTKFSVDTEKMHDVRLVGGFRASGGSGNDIQVVLADENEFENWINGHQARVLYSTGKTTTGKIDVAIMEPGTYILAFSNVFSMFADKDVFAEVELRYKTRK
jgi:predicted nucleic acid-binding Zn ribbon protein